MRRVDLLFGIVLSIVAASCDRDSSKDDAPPSGPPPTVRIYEKVRPALLDQPYTPEDESCFNLSGLTSCLPEQAARLSEPETVSVEKVLKRSFVHQEWVAQRLRQVLEFWPAELLPLASCTNSIMVGNSIVVSRHKLGVIFISPKYFAVTAEEKATLADGVDPRSKNYTAALFNETSIYSKLPNYSLSQSEISSAEKVMLILASHVLIHEMVHSCDFNASGDRSLTPRSIGIPQLPFNILSKYRSFYSRGEEMFAAEVKETPLDSYIDVMVNDESLFLYDYENQLEHFADLVEVLLQKIFLGVGNRSLIAIPQPGHPEGASQIHAVLDNQLCLPQVWRKAKKALDLLGIFPANLVAEDPDCEFTLSKVQSLRDDYMKSHKAELIP